MYYLLSEGVELVEVLDVQGEDLNTRIVSGDVSQLFGLKFKKKNVNQCSVL